MKPTHLPDEKCYEQHYCAVLHGCPTSTSGHSPVRSAWYRETQTTLVGILDLLFLQTDEPVQCQTPVLRHCGVEILRRKHNEKEYGILVILLLINPKFKLKLMLTHNSLCKCICFACGKATHL